MAIKTKNIKPKKPFYKRWWFITLAVLFVFGLLNPKKNEVPTSKLLESPKIEVSSKITEPIKTTEIISTSESNTTAIEPTKTTQSIQIVQSQEPITQSQETTIQSQEPITQSQETIEAIEPSTIPDQPVEEVQASAQEEEPSEETESSIDVTSPISRGETASVYLVAKPNTQYTIKVLYPSGASTAKGLESKTSDSEGSVRWSWKIGGKTSFGDHRIIVSGGGEQFTTSITVQ